MSERLHGEARVYGKTNAEQAQRFADLAKQTFFALDPDVTYTEDVVNVITGSAQALALTSLAFSHLDPEVLSASVEEEKQGDE